MHAPTGQDARTTPPGKKNGLDGNWPRYNEGCNYMGWMAKMADRARELLGIPKGKKGSAS